MSRKASGVNIVVGVNFRTSPNYSFGGLTKALAACTGDWGLGDLL